MTESFQTMCTQGHEYKNNSLDIRSLSSLLVDYLLRWPSSKKRLASEID